MAVMESWQFTSRRVLLAALGTFPIVLTGGCLESEDNGDFLLNPDEFEDDSLHLTAEGVARTDLELTKVTRSNDGWIRAEMQFDGNLDEHIRIPPGINQPTPVPAEQIPEYLSPPAFETIIDWFSKAVEQGENGAGLILSYTDGECSSSTNIPISLFEWYIDGQFEIDTIYLEAEQEYEVVC